jgi:hypothetical protein
MWIIAIPGPQKQGTGGTHFLVEGRAVGGPNIGPPSLIFAAYIQDKFLRYIQFPRFCGYTHVQGGALWPPASEVRLPQGLRFTDVRRSAPGDFAVARGGPSASKSRGRARLCRLPLSLYSLRLPLAADFDCANLRPLLG